MRESGRSQTINQPQCKKIMLRGGIEKGERGSGWEKEFIIEREI